MNKIFKVIYSKTRHCYVVVSELAKSHCKTTQSHTVRSKTALTAAVLLALGAFSFVGMPVVQAADGTESLKNNDYVGANGYYWYFDEKTNQWTKYPYKLSNINNNRSWQELPNYKGGGAKEPGAVTAGLYAQAGEQTITIGNRNAGQSKGSVFIGELDRYNDGGKNAPVGMRNNYVTAVGFQSNATGWGSIAIGSNAVAENTQETSQVVDYEGSSGTSGTVQDDNYGIKLNPSITGSSVALGYSAQAKDGNIAIGAYSDATDTSSATPYVSVGSSTLQRRITNVADGKGDTDVATVGQMNKAIESIGTTGWNLSTNGNSSSTTITSGKTVDFSPAVDGKNRTTDHKNVKISNDGSNVKIGLNKDIVLGEATNGNGGSLNVYSDSTEASNLGNRVSIDGSTVSVYYGSEEGASGTKRGVVLGVGEDWNRNAQGYIAFNNIDPNGKIDSTYLHSATDAPDNLKGRLVYSNTMSGTEYIANLDDGITFTGDVQKDVPKDYTQTPTKLNTTLNITGGAATEKGLTSGNIGVVSTPAAEKKDGTTQASKLEIKLNKDLKGITSITSQTTDGTTTSGATITLGTNGTTISGGDVNVNTHKITGLKDGTATTDAATVGQMNTAIGNAKTKYYSVTNSLKLGDYRTNENNDGAADYALAGMAAGYETGTTGIASTVAGSYSGVIGSGLQGAAAVSVGTVNVNKNTDPNKKFSGVANSIVGQANMTTNSNAAIIYGAGNTVKNSYRDIDTKNASEIKAAAESGDVTKLGEALQKAVPTSGGQVMVMGGGNNVESAYMSQVVGVGNTVKGNQVKDDKKGWVTDTSPETAINNYDPKKSSQYNYVDGFNNEVINGKHDYVIGANNKLSGDSYDDKEAKKYSNESNIVFGDNHTLTNTKNAVIIGSSDTQMILDKGDNATAIGHNASAQRDALAVGVNTEARGNAVALGTSTIAHNNSIAIGTKATVVSSQNLAIGWEAHVGNIKTDDEKIKNAVALGSDSQVKVNDLLESDNNRGVLSIGDKDKERRIIHVRAGVNDTDAVNVSQLKYKANVNASNIGSNITVAPIYKKDAEGNDIIQNGQKVIDQKATEDAQKAARTANENAWGTAIGTGKVADPTQSEKNDPTQNGSQQLVTGGEVYNALHGGLTDITVGKAGKDGKDGKDGSIGLVGQTGQKGENGKNAYATTIIKTEKGVDGVDGKNGEDGITRIVYNDTNDPANKHTVATLDDGMKYVGDTGATANVKLDHQLKLSGTTFDEKDENKKYKEADWTSGNIAVVSGAADDKTGDATMYLKLAKDLKNLNSSTYTTETTGEGDQQKTTTYTTIINGKGLTIQSGEQGSTTSTSGPSITIDGINGGGKQITNVGNGITTDKDGNYTISDADKTNAANIGDVQTIVNDAKKDLTDGTNGLNNKANVNASNIGNNITVAPIYKKDAEGNDIIQNGQKVIDQKATEDAQKAARTANENAWGTAIGTGKVADPTQSEKNDPTQNGSQQLVTGGEVYNALHGGLTDITVGKAGKDGKDGKDGSIGLVGQTGQKGENGKNAYATTIIKTEKGVDGVDGKNGEDGITRIVYNDTNDPANKHTVATLDDGMKYVGDTGATANVKLDHQLKLSGTTFDEKDENKKYKEADWTSGNIAVVSGAADDKTGDATMYLKLAKDLKNLNSSTYTTETTGEGDQQKTTTYTTIINGKGLTIQSGEQGSTTSTSGPSITIDGIDGGSKAITNIGSGIEKDDKGNYTDKSKSSAANIGDVQTIVKDAKDELISGDNGLNSKANVDASNIGENLKDAKGNKASADEIKKNKEDWASAIGTNTVEKGNKQLVTSGAVATALDKKADKTYVDEKLDTKADKSDVYTKTEVDSKVTDITKGLDGKAGKDLDNISDKGNTVIHNIAKDAVTVVNGKNTTVTKVNGTDTTPTTYAVHVEGTGTVASGNTGLISGDTLYNEVHVDKDGTYIKSKDSATGKDMTVAQNLSALDSGLKTTSDLIHTNTKGDTIQIGGNSTATKIDVNGKDGKGRVITGVVSDANDPNSAANVGYVNGLTAANTQQIYRDMNNAYSRLDTNINRAAAGSNALAALHPLDFDPADKASFAVGYGHYRNANAAAVGAFYQPNANTMVNMGISLGNGDPGFNAGVSFKIGKGSAYNGVSKAEMAQTIHDQATEISAIKADDAAKDKRIDALEKENQEMKKQIQEILARLNG